MVIEKKVESMGGKRVVVLKASGIVKLGEGADIFFRWIDCIKEENVVIDMGAIDYFDSTSLGEFIGYCAKFVEKGKKTAILNPSHCILYLLRATQLDKLIKVFTNRAEAIESFAN